ncbi:Smr/MutS family protein [Sphingomonas sp. 28-63-12]|uniref:Smr/MutS family protein n=1 Tax=Sphingomonas sp. 28-63-12 TaxID=1970434 RepID=UPI000BCB6E7C|nr:MAG: DNA mismatch repair protein MutS [Sphingomonas sp. 28-63-12]
MATVRPVRAVQPNPIATLADASPADISSASAPGAGLGPRGKPGAKLAAAPRVQPKSAAVVVPRPKPGVTLDGSWDKKLATGIVAPDSAIDLHGHTLDSAHHVLDAGLDRAIRQGDRVLLLITGKPPRPESERPHARGRIRDAVGDWLAASRHAANIAAVRPAHPRHGGAGALYIVLRRPRNERKY